MTLTRRLTRKREKGFTIMEMLVVVAVLGVLLLISAPAFLRMINRFKLTGTSREVSALMSAGRMEAIKYNAPAHIEYDADSNTFIAWVDLNRDGALAAPPDRILGANVPLPAKVKFWGPGDGAENGANAIDGWDDAPTPRLGPIINPDGSIDRVGAYRLKDPNDNYLEVRIETPATARMVLKKYVPAVSKFLRNGEDGQQWVWN